MLLRGVKIAVDDQSLQLIVQVPDFRYINRSFGGEGGKNSLLGAIGTLNLGENPATSMGLTMHLQRNCPLSDTLLAGEQKRKIGLGDLGQRSPDPRLNIGTRLRPSFYPLDGSTACHESSRTSALARRVPNPETQRGKA